MYVGGTGSSHTVCQIPEHGVYQIPSGLVVCFPRACVSAVTSVTSTTTSCSPEGRSASVMSKEKLSYPPVCLPTSLPFTRTLDSKSTAPKCRITRWDFQFAGTVNVLRYVLLSKCFPTPESADSMQNGTRICPAGAPSGAKSHSPLRFSQSLRTICGRGY